MITAADVVVRSNPPYDLAGILVWLLYIVIIIALIVLVVWIIRRLV